jgi:membrane protein DedA with SNARE-associated domain
MIILGAALLLRLILGYSYPPYPETMKDWAQRIVETGFAGFYGPEVQWPYPPLYLYILWVLGLIIKVFNVTDPGLKELIIELPPILCDIAASVLLWKVASKRLDEKKALLVTALYAFNPAAIHNSSMWGQTDSVFTLAVALMCVFFCEKKYLKAFIAFGAGLMLKQQTLTFAPVVIAALIAAVVPAGSLNKTSVPEGGGTASLRRLSILIARLLPFISFDIVSYAAGLTSMSFGGFLVATGLGQLPATLVYSYVGGMLTGGARLMVTGLLILFALSGLIVLIRQVYTERNKSQA